MKDYEGIFTMAEKIAELKAKADRVDQKPRRVRAPRNYKHLNRLPNESLAQMMHRHLDEADQLNKIIEDRVKAGKKEDKKDDKKGLSKEQWIAVLVAPYPIIGMLLLWWMMR